jgi:hypothetical protein
LTKVNEAVALPDAIPGPPDLKTQMSDKWKSAAWTVKHHFGCSDPGGWNVASYSAHPIEEI